MDPDAESADQAAQQLKQALRLALISNGTLGAARAMLRSGIRGALNPKLDHAHRTNPDPIALAIVRDFLLASGLTETADQLDIETMGLTAKAPERNALASELGIQAEPNLLENLLKNRRPAQGFRPEETEEEAEVVHSSTVSWSERSGSLDEMSCDEVVHR
jgi:hypothetical protein